MASVPKGPGQPEVTGDLRDAQQPNVPGTYKDPVSGAVVTTMAPAGADALVRMGFELQDDSKDSA